MPPVNGLTQVILLAQSIYKLTIPNGQRQILSKIICFDELLKCLIAKFWVGDHLSTEERSFVISLVPVLMRESWPDILTRQDLTEPLLGHA